MERKKMFDQKSNVYVYCYAANKEISLSDLNIAIKKIRMQADNPADTKVFLKDVQRILLLPDNQNLSVIEKFQLCNKKKLYLETLGIDAIHRGEKFSLTLMRDTDSTIIYITLTVEDDEFADACANSFFPPFV